MSSRPCGSRSSCGAAPGGDQFELVLVILRGGDRDRRGLRLVETATFARRVGAASRAARSAGPRCRRPADRLVGGCSSSSQARSGLRSCRAARRSSAASASTQQRRLRAMRPSARDEAVMRQSCKRANRGEQRARFGRAARVAPQLTQRGPLRAGGQQSVGQIGACPLRLQRRSRRIARTSGRAACPTACGLRRAARIPRRRESPPGAAGSAR